MKKLAPGLLAGTAALALGITVLQPASAQPAAAGPERTQAVGHESGHGSGQTHRSDNRPGPLTAREHKKKAKALALLANGSADLVQRREGATVALGASEFVEFPIEKTDKVFTILAEFGSESSGRFGRTPGPLHNAIPAPDREVNNSTAWVPDFDRAYYEDLFNGVGESFKDYYLKLSSGRYTAINTVSDWVQVPGNASLYGDNAVEDDGGSWAFVQDSGDAWYAAQLQAGKTPAEIDSYLSQFDVWDRYDFDEDGNFNEADGYIDHFQAVHAGEGEDAGGGAQGEDAIWSHRWYVNGDQYGQTGPSVGDAQNLYGGARIGDSKYFIGDYTIEPENGGLGVFAHEFGHDLGLPDYYDTDGGENGTAFWTLMSSGSWLSHGTEDIGSTPGLMGPEEKLFLGWLDHVEVDGGEDGTFVLGPSQHTYDDAEQAIKVNLQDVVTETAYTAAPEGANAWYSGRGDELNHKLTRDVPAASQVVVTADVWHQIEAGYDFLYAEWSTDGGQTWQQAGNPIDGASRGWIGKRFSYSPGGLPSKFRFRYQTDGGVNEAGAFLDNIAISAGRGYSFTDGAEAGDNGWTRLGWATSTGTETKTTPRYYLLENRQYVGYDATLQTGPYQFSEGITRPDWVERFPFQDGMLVWYVNHAYPDNNVSTHAGFGNAMVVDARPLSLTYPDGTRPSNRRQPFDATFGRQATDEVCLHKQVADSSAAGYATAAACAPSSAAMPTFDDSNPEAYWSSVNPQNSVKVAGVGVTATVVAEDGNRLTVQVHNP